VDGVIVTPWIVSESDPVGVTLLFYGVTVLRCYIVILSLLILILILSYSYFEASKFY